jgi:hypothetical protein
VEAGRRAADLLRAEREELLGGELPQPVRDLREPAPRALVEEPAAQSAAYSAVVKLVSTKDLLPSAATVPIASV